MIDASKCLFGQRHLDFQGYGILLDGFAQLPVKVDAISTFSQQTAAKGLEEFVRMINF